MLTYTYISKGKFGLVEKPKPTIQHERDAIVKVTLPCLICKSLEQMLASVTLTIASRSCCIIGFGFSTKPNFPFDMYV